MFRILLSSMPIFLTLIAINDFNRSAFADAASPTMIEGATMGTTYHIKWMDSGHHAEEIKRLVDARLVEINKQMSTYDPESELSRFNASTSTDWFPVSNETAIVVRAALNMSEISDGAFDPTVGRLVRMWSFGRDPHLNEPPGEEQIASALKSVGYQLVSVQDDPPALRKAQSDVELDLSAIAKGYGVDAVWELLDTQKIENYMVEIGGEVRTAGTRNGERWTLGIERPEELERSLYAKVELTDQALATSGDYRNYFEKDGVRYSHTIDPRTGQPVEHQLASASIVAENCMTADAWATTMMVLGSEKGLLLADKHNITAYLLERNGENFRELASHNVVAQFVRIDQPEPGADAAMSPFFMTFLISLTVFGIAIIGLAIGVILSNKSLKGSCGGVDGAKDEHGNSICDLCTTPPEQCDRLKEELRRQATRPQSSATE